MKTTKPDVVTMPKIRIKGLQSFAGRAVQVFYVSGRKATFATKGSALKVYTVRVGPLKGVIDSTGSVTIPGIEMSKKGVYTFNFIYWVITKSETDPALIRNIDGTFAEDPRYVATANHSEEEFKVDRCYALSVLDFEKKKVETENGSPLVTLDVEKDKPAIQSYTLP